MESSRASGEGGLRRTCSRASDVVAFGYGNCMESRWRRNPNLPRGFFGSVFANLDGFRRDEMFTDVALIVENKRIAAHRCLLAAASPFFSAMFSSGMVEARQKEVELSLASYEEIKSVIDYIYTGQVPRLSRATAGDIIKVADLLLVQDLKMLCVDYMTKNMITERDAILTLVLAEVQNVESLVNEAADFISKNVDLVLESEYFVDLDVDTLTAFLRSDHILFEPEDKAFEALWRWISHRIEERLPYLEDLLPYIRLELVNRNSVVETTLHHEFMGENQNAKEFVEAVLTYHGLQVHQNVSCKSTPEEISAKVSPQRVSTPETSVKPRKGPSVQCSVVIESAGLTLEANQINVDHSEICKVACYIPRENQWQSLPDAPFRIVDATPSTIYFKGGLYVLGGELGAKVYRLALDEFVPKWKEIANLNQKRAQGCCVLYHKNELYVIGGSSSKRKKKSRQRDAIEKYDEVNNKWILCDPLPHPCYRCDVVFLASDNVLLRTYEYQDDGDHIHYYYGPNIAKIREENDERIVEELSRASGPPPEQLNIIAKKTSMQRIRRYECSYGQRNDILRPPFVVRNTAAVCNALIVRRALDLIPAVPTTEMEID